VERAFRSPSPPTIFAIVALIAVSTGGCGGGEDNPKVTPVTLPTVTVPAAAEPTGTVAKQHAGLGGEGKALYSSNASAEHSSKSSASKTGTPSRSGQGVEADGAQGGSSGKTSVANPPGNGVDPSPLPSGPGPLGAHNGIE
jgi:hypothetical protein